MKKIIVNIAPLFILAILFSLNSCTKEEMPQQAEEAIALAPQNLADDVCRSMPTSQIVNYTRGMTVGNTISVTDPNGTVTSRQFKIYVPSDFNQERYYPLVYMFHGRAQTATRMVNRTTWNQLAEFDDFIVVYPQALTYDVGGTMMTHWDTRALAAQVPAGTVIFDDVTFFRDMNKAIGKTLPIYCDSIYTCGFSNGNAFNKEKIRVEVSDIVAATSGSGNIGDFVVELPLNGTHRPHYEVCGTLDNLAVGFCQAQGETFNALPLTPSVIANTPCIRDRVDNLRQGMELAQTGTPSTGTYNNGLQFTDVVFNNSLVGQNVEYKFRLVQSLRHKVPSSNNNFTPDHIVKFWVWMKRFEL